MLGISTSLDTIIFTKTKKENHHTPDFHNQKPHRLPPCSRHSLDHIRHAENKKCSAQYPKYPAKSA